MPFRYRCLECEFDHFSPGVTSAHEANEGHECESYTVDQEDGYNWQGIPDDESTKGDKSDGGSR